jgi:ABC-type sugar transport system ATPase subunit
MQLAVHGVHKSFADNRVLRGVDLQVTGGEVVALVGENGAGKSTLTRVLSGVYRPDGGTVAIDGEPVTFRDPQDAMARGIQVIYQEFRQNLFAHLSVAENLFVREEGRQFGRLLVSKGRMYRRAAELLASIGVHVDPRAEVGQLGVAQQQMVEIAKSIGHHLNVLILDEPTAALDDRESEQLFTQVRRLRADGVGIVYISHRLDEVFALADRVIVLRDGAVTIQGATGELTRDQVVGAMVGRTVGDFYPKEENARPEVALSVSGLRRSGAFEEVSFDVHAGEILGLGGVMGSGRTELLRSLFGLEPADSGIVSMGGQPMTASSPAAAIRRGIAYITPDRQADGLCPGRSVAENISLAALRSLSQRLGIVQRRLESDRVAAAMTQLQVRASSPNVDVGTLSGGNQQKALFGKWVMTRPRVLLMEEPTRGVDVGAKTEIYRILNQLTATGVAVVMVSSDLPELVAMSDRVLVLRAGRVVAELTGERITQQTVLDNAMEVAA